jgi:hypothetical protein
MITIDGKKAFYTNGHEFMMKYKKLSINSVSVYQLDLGDWSQKR